MARKSVNIDDKKAIHVSFSDKEYCEKMQKIIKKWDENGINRSQKVCDIVIAMSKFERSPGINRMLTTYDWIENTISPYFENPKSDDFTKVVDTIFNEILEINSAKLATFLSNPKAYIVNDTNNIDGVNNVSMSPTNQTSANNTSVIKEEVTANEEVETPKNVVKNEEVSYTENRTFIKKEDVLNDTYDNEKEDNKKDISDDFQVNKDNINDILKTFQ